MNSTDTDTSDLPYSDEVGRTSKRNSDTRSNTGIPDFQQQHPYTSIELLFLSIITVAVIVGSWWWMWKGEKMVDNGFELEDQLELSLHRNPQKAKFRFATWVHGGNLEFDEEQWKKKLSRYHDLKISEILCEHSTPDFLNKLITLAREYDIRVHAWVWALNAPNDPIASKHPEWYSVNRLGKNSLKDRPYVDYYQWLSPFHPDARNHVINKIKKLIGIENLASIHLDYIRYCDIFLGSALQPKYDIVQDHEMPQFDFGYHPLARKRFLQIFGKDPVEMKNPELSIEWHQFRLNAVNEIYRMVHSNRMKLSAAVFPYPELARRTVRQSWSDWNLDMVFPMVYHSFRNESIQWVGFATEQSVSDVQFPVYTGLYIPGFNSAEDFEKAITIAKKKGAVGVCFYTADILTNEFVDFEEVLHRLGNELVT